MRLNNKSKKIFTTQRGGSVKSFLSNVISGDIATSIKNALPSSDRTARPSFKGEVHGVLRLPNGKTGIANYLGPGTNIVKRLERGDPPRTLVDTVAKAHDIRYSLARNENDIRKADNKMIDSVNKIQKNKSDAIQNILQAKLIKGKVMAEDVGFLKRTAFSGDLKGPANDGDRRVLQSNLEDLEQSGYGDHLPAAILKKKIFKFLKKEKNKEILKEVNNNLEGSANVVVKHVFPQLLKKLDIAIKEKDKSKINKIIHKVYNDFGSTPSKNIAAISKTLLTLLVNTKMKGMGLTEKQKNMKTDERIDSVLGDKKLKLQKMLSRVLMNIFKHKMKSRDMGGTGFFDDFHKGFDKIFKPISTIAGTALSVLGYPEFGIPLKTIGGVL